MPAERAGRGRRLGGGLLASELRLVFGRRRTQGVLAMLALIPVILAVAVKVSSPPAPGEGPPLLDRITQNGLFVGVTSVILCVSLFLPLAASVVAGDTIAGEASTGTLRYLLVVPVGRTRLLLVKLVVALVFCVVATLTLVLVGAVLGYLLFGAEPAPLLSGDTVGVAESLRREAIVAGYAALSLSGLVAVGLFVSTLTDVPVAAMASTTVLAIVSQILGQVPQLDWLHPWLPTAHWFDIGDVLRTPIAWRSLQLNAGLQACYVVVFVSAAWARFTTRDILS